VKWKCRDYHKPTKILLNFNHHYYHTYYTISTITITDIKMTAIFDVVNYLKLPQLTKMKMMIINRAVLLWYDMLLLQGKVRLLHETILHYTTITITWIILRTSCYEAYQYSLG